MKVSDLMTTDVGVSHLEDSLTTAAEIMWQKDCGAVPVVDDEDRVVGMITDRDICIAVATRHRKTSEIKAKEMLKDSVISCYADDNIRKALKKMRKNQIKRLPVISQDGKIIGIFSITDVLVSVRKRNPLNKKVFSTLKEIYKPRPILLREVSVPEASQVKGA